MLCGQVGDTEQQGVIHDIEVCKDGDVLLNLSKELMLLVSSHVDESLIGFEEVDVFEYLCTWILDLPCHGGPLHVVLSISQPQVIKDAERIFHEYESDAADIRYFNSVEPEDPGDNAIRFMQQVCIVVWKKLHEGTHIAVIDCLYHKFVVVAEEEEAATRPQRFLCLFYALSIAAHLQRLF